MENILFGGLNEARKWTVGMIRDSPFDWNVLSGTNYLEMSISYLLKDLRLLLDSKFEKEKIDGLKRLLALLIRGLSVIEYFPIVIKNVANPSFRLRYLFIFRYVRKYVYIILLKYAHQESDMALLAINTLQKDMSDQNAFIRATALNVMSMIRIPELAPLCKDIN